MDAAIAEVEAGDVPGQGYVTYGLGFPEILPSPYQSLSTEMMARPPRLSSRSHLTIFPTPPYFSHWGQIPEG